MESDVSNNSDFQVEKLIEVLSSCETIQYCVNASTGEYVYLSPEFEKKLGYTADDISKFGGRKNFQNNVIQKSFLISNPSEKNPGERQIYIYEEWWVSKEGKLFCFLNKFITTYTDSKIVRIDGIMIDIAKERKFMTQLERDKFYLDSIMNFSTDKIYFKDIDGRFIKANRRMIEDGGFKSEKEILGKTDFELFGIRHAQQAYLDEQKVIETGTPIADKAERENWNDGRVTWASSSKIPLRDDNGKIIGVFGISRDITEKMKSQEAVLQNEERINSLYLFNQLSDYAEDQIKQHVLKEVIRLTGSMLGNIFMFDDIRTATTEFSNETENNYSADELTLLKEHLQKYFYNYKNIKEPYFNNELTDNLPSVSSITLERQISAPIVDNGEVIGIISVCNKKSNYEDMDVVELDLYATNMWKMINRKRMEDELFAEREKLKIIVNSIDECILATDIAGKIIKVNQALLKMTAMPEGEILDLTFRELFHKLYLRFSHESKNEKQNNEDRTNKFEKPFNPKHRFFITNAKGESKVITISFKELRDNLDILSGYVYVVYDLTDILEMERRLSQSQKLESVGVLAAGIAHEINSPLQYVGDNVRFLESSFLTFMDYLSPQQPSNDDIEVAQNIKRNIDENISEELDFLKSEVPRAISQTLEGIDRMRKIVYAMKDFAHPGVLSKSYSNINHGIEVTIDISRNKWKYVAEMNVNLAPDLPPVFCVLDEINQVILNVIVNAAQAIEEKIKRSGEEKGEIQIETSEKDGYVCIRIKDSGIGIEKNNIAKVFDPFFTTKEVGVGTGQGLAISHDIIVNKHNGEISVESEPGRGTTFVINLPIKE